MTDHVPNLKSFVTIKFGEYGDHRVKVGPAFCKSFNLCRQCLGSLAWDAKLTEKCNCGGGSSATGGSVVNTARSSIAMRESSRAAFQQRGKKRARENANLFD